MNAPRLAYDRLPPAEQGALLRRVLARCGETLAGAEVLGQGSPPPVVVFDLDGTLMDNRPRTCAILKEIAVLWEQTEPTLASRLAGATPEKVPYHFKETLAVFGVEREDLQTFAFDYWKTHFFADPHIQHDVEVKGAARFARACYNAGANIVYLTGRDLPQMGVGTFGSLKTLGFPIGVCGTELVLKPDPKMLDFEFKRFEGPKLARVGRVVAAFDNEPENCNVFLAQFPDAESVLLDTQHAGGAPALADGVKVIPDFALG